MIWCEITAYKNGVRQGRLKNDVGQGRTRMVSDKGEQNDVGQGQTRMMLDKGKQWQTGTLN